VPEDPFGFPLLRHNLSVTQWRDVELMEKALRQDYEYRRLMLLQRVDVTIQSFTWSDRLRVSNLYYQLLYLIIKCFHMICGFVKYYMLERFNH